MLIYFRYTTNVGNAWVASKSPDIPICIIDDRAEHFREFEAKIFLQVLFDKKVTISRVHQYMVTHRRTYYFADFIWDRFYIILEQELNKLPFFVPLPKEDYPDYDDIKPINPIDYILETYEHLNTLIDISDELDIGLATLSSIRRGLYTKAPHKHTLLRLASLVNKHPTIIMLEYAKWLEENGPREPYEYREQVTKRMKREKHLHRTPVKDKDGYAIFNKYWRTTQDHIMGIESAHLCNEMQWDESLRY